MTRPILPGATLGILGGGQLGRMTAMAARTLGYHVEALDPDPSCAARFVVDQCHTAMFDDADAAAVLAVIQDRGRQKSWLESHRFPVGPWRLARTAADVEAAVEALGGRCFVKATSGGYDGRGQVETSSASEAPAAWAALGEEPCAVEKLSLIHI